MAKRGGNLGFGGVPIDSAQLLSHETARQVDDPPFGFYPTSVCHVTACAVSLGTVNVILPRDKGFGGFWAKLSDYILHVLTNVVGAAQLGMSRGWVGRHGAGLVLARCPGCV